jgi:hypothetical protein
VWEASAAGFAPIQVAIMSRRSASSPASSGEATAPIDEDEQDKIADELKLQALAQSTSFRNIFHYIFLVVVLILFICLLYSIFSPWEIDHQQVFKDLLPIYGFFSYYCASMFCFLVAAMIVKVMQVGEFCPLWR